MWRVPGISVLLSFGDSGMLGSRVSGLYRGVYVYVYTFIYVYIYICTYVCVYVYIYIYVAPSREANGKSMETDTETGSV